MLSLINVHACISLLAPCKVPCTDADLHPVKIAGQQQTRTSLVQAQADILTGSGVCVCQKQLPHTVASMQASFIGLCVRSAPDCFQPGMARMPVAPCRCCRSTLLGGKWLAGGGKGIGEMRPQGACEMVCLVSKNMLGCKDVRCQSDGHVNEE